VYFRKWLIAEIEIGTKIALFAGLDIVPQKIVSFEELLMSQVVQQEALTRLLVEKEIFIREEFLEMVRTADNDIIKKAAKQRGLKVKYEIPKEIDKKPFKFL
jgi:hypothetical protein